MYEERLLLPGDFVLEARIRDGLDFVLLLRKGKTVLVEYSNSKLANALFSAELARKLVGTGVTTYALHPGVVATDVWREVPWPFRGLMKLGMISVEQGALTTLHCATAPECASETGLYYDKCRVKTPSAMAQDQTLAAELWQRSEEWAR